MLLMLAAAPLAAVAQNDFENMTPEERREAFDNLSEEERDAVKQRMRERWDSMTPEEREAFTERRRMRGDRGGRAGQRSRANEESGS